MLMSPCIHFGAFTSGHSGDIGAFDRRPEQILAIVGAEQAKVTSGGIQVPADILWSRHVVIHKLTARPDHYCGNSRANDRVAVRKFRAMC
jgi:hypothetical protein